MAVLSRPCQGLKCRFWWQSCPYYRLFALFWPDWRCVVAVPIFILAGVCDSRKDVIITVSLCTIPSWQHHGILGVLQIRKVYKCEARSSYNLFRGWTLSAKIGLCSVMPIGVAMSLFHNIS